MINVSIGILDRYSSDLKDGDWVELSWWQTKHDTKKRARLHQKMYGHYVDTGNKRYYYNGVLMVWADVVGKKIRVKIHEFVVLNRGHIVVPRGTQQILDRIFSDLQIDHRWHPYLPKRNLVVVYG